MKAKTLNNLLIFLLLTVIIVLLEYIILAPHLKYAFADVDWAFLLSFKEISNTYHNPISHLLGAWKSWGVYTYQVYYIGLIQKFFGMDYRNFQVVTHVFKIIATLSLYPLIWYITKSRLMAFITTILYGVSYSSVGVMYTVVTSGLFVAIPVMMMFLLWYARLIKKGKNSVPEMIIAMLLFFSTILLATERMYPLVPSLFLIELYWWFKNQYSRKILMQIIKRVGVFLVVFVLIFLFKPATFTAFFGNTNDIYTRFIAGNWQVVMTPTISLGSLFLPHDYWKYIGTPNIDNIASYFGFVLLGPFILFTAITVFLSLFLSKTKRKFILLTLGIFLFFSAVVYILSSHQLSILDVGKMHFDIDTILPALLGSYIIALNVTMFTEWLTNGKKDDLVIFMVGAMTIAMVYIILTWVAADYVLVFTGVHRYLTLPAVGSSVFIAGLLTIFFNKLHSHKSTKLVAYFVFLLLIPLILFNARIITDYFTYELQYAGTDAAGHIRMKTKLGSYLGDISKTSPSIFYFDESKDHDNGYFDETTTMAGFGNWMRFRGSDIVSGKLTPAILRSNLICKEERSMCLSAVKKLVTERNGEKGILYGEVFYRVKDFYAFRFINKDIIDIKREVTAALGLE